MNWRNLLSMRFFLPSCCLASALLAAIAIVSFSIEFSAIHEKEQAISSVERNLLRLGVHAQQKQQMELLAQKSDRHRFEQQFSTLSLLNLEKGSLELQKTKTALSESEIERFRFIQKDNALHFKSQRKIDNGSCREIEEKLIHAVEVDADDLQTVLEKIEAATDLEEAMPLRIQRLSLEKIENSPHYTLYLELWRKEIL